MSDDSARSEAAAKPVIFISYSHKDEPEKPAEGEVQWLSFVRTYLQPAVKHGVVDLFDDQRLAGGAALDPEIEKKLRTCDVFLLLISAHSLASPYIFDTEIRITRERLSSGEDVRFYPLLLTPTPKVALDKLKDMVIRPRDAKPLSAFPYGERIQLMNDAADEIAAIAAEISNRKPLLPLRPQQPAFVHITGLPETAYEHLVGRERELEQLDDAWVNRNTNILSLIAEGGAGKSALVNEWLKRMQADNYRGSEAVLGWSFYSQGTKERATSAEPFLTWALEKLRIKINTTGVSAKADAIAEAMVQRRILLILDGMEPLQQGPGVQTGQLKDPGLRSLLRRFAAVPSSHEHGLIILTSRIAVTDVARWKDTSAPVERVDKLSNQAGAALLRDNGVWGTDNELKVAAHTFGGHPLALALLASFLKETQFGDVRRHDRVRDFFADSESPRHDHARRVMESYEKEWLSGQPVQHAIMRIVGLFDRPASVDCLRALRAKPTIAGLTDMVVDLEEGEWQRAVARLREVRLLAPPDPSTRDALDAHPLIREWFGLRLKKTNREAWRAAHGRLYEHLRDTTKEADEPSLEHLGLLYQAIVNGCQAGRYQETLGAIYWARICKRGVSQKVGNREIQTLGSHGVLKLGLVGSELAAMASFFKRPYQEPVHTISKSAAADILQVAAVCLRSQGRLTEALSVDRALLSRMEPTRNKINGIAAAIDLSEVELLVGEIASAVHTANQAIKIADQIRAPHLQVVARSTRANALFAHGQSDEAERLFAEAERTQQHHSYELPLLYGVQGYWYCDLLLATRRWQAVTERSRWMRRIENKDTPLLDKGLARLAAGRGHVGLALTALKSTGSFDPGSISLARSLLDESIDWTRTAGTFDILPSCIFVRAAFRRSAGDWDGSARDLDEVEEIAEPGPMRLYLCDMALERARLAFAEIEAFAPLNGFTGDSPSKPVAPDVTEAAGLKDDAEKQLAIGADYVETCGYHRRDEELVELQAVLRGEKKFADLPPRV
jgi:tetratricopeptide (TPR) repeat protein